MPYRPMYVLAGNGVSDASPDMLTRCNEARWPPSPEATTMGDACLGSALEKKKALLRAKTAFANKGRESYPLDIFAKKQGRFGVVFLKCISSETTWAWNEVWLLRGMRYLGMVLTKVSHPHSVTWRKDIMLVVVTHVFGARARKSKAP